MPPRAKQAHLWERDPLDWYVEPAWCSERLFNVERFLGRVWDPCAGTGRIAVAARLAGLQAFSTDVDPRGFDGVDYCDFCKVPSDLSFENIVTNPPYKLAREVVEQALAIATGKVAAFVGENWVTGEKRSKWLATTPLRRVLFICPRPSCPPGTFLAGGGKAGNGSGDFVWMIWEKGFTGTPELGWCRRDV